MPLLVSNAKTEFWLKVMPIDQNYIFNRCFRKVIYLTGINYFTRDVMRMNLGHDIIYDINHKECPLPRKMSTP